MKLRAKSLGGAGFGFGSFFFAIFGWSGGFQRLQKAQGDIGDVIDGGEESGFVGSGWLVEASDFADELKRSRADLVFGDGGIEVEKGFDVSAHEWNSQGRS